MSWALVVGEGRAREQGGLHVASIIMISHSASASGKRGLRDGAQLLGLIFRQL